MLVRDATYGGACYTTATALADDLGAHVVAVRKAIRELESLGWIVKTETKNGGARMLLNPNYVTVGSDQDEEIAKAIWMKERRKAETASAR